MIGLVVFILGLLMVGSNIDARIKVVMPGPFKSIIVSGPVGAVMIFVGAMFTGMGV